MHVREELVVGLLALIVALICWMWTVVDESNGRSRKLPRRSDPPQRPKDVEDSI